MIQERAQVLTFRLDDEVFAFPVSQVREVMDMTSITRLPLTPEPVRGIINLRGAVVPVIDLRSALGLPPAERQGEGCIIVVELVRGDGTLIVGAVADGVREVVDLDAGEPAPAPFPGGGPSNEPVGRVARHDNRLLMVLDLERVMGAGAGLPAAGGAAA